jgi:hypothetical protein
MVLQYLNNPYFAYMLRSTEMLYYYARPRNNIDH